MRDSDIGGIGANVLSGKSSFSFERIL